MQKEFRNLKSVVLGRGVRFEGMAGLFCSATRVEDEVGMLEAKIEIMLPDLCEAISIPSDQPTWSPDIEEDMCYAIALARERRNSPQEGAVNSKLVIFDVVVKTIH